MISKHIISEKFPPQVNDHQMLLKVWQEKYSVSSPQNSESQVSTKTS